MRTLKGQGIIRDTDTANFPDGQILNETNTVQGTPVVREVYGDLLTNIYAILRDAGITPNESEDSSTTSYQLLQAFKVFHNQLNDLEQVLTVSGSNITTSFDFDSLPENYVFIGVVTGAIAKNTNYNFVSSGSKILQLNSSMGISASSVVLVCLKNTTASILNLSDTASQSVISTAFGTPISFNESSKMLYLSNGTVFDESPKSYLVENVIQVSEGSLDIKVLDVVAHKGKLICFTINISTLEYQAFSFDLSDLSVFEGEIAVPSISGIDNQPHMFCDGTNLFFTNSTSTINNSTDDFALGTFVFDENALTITSVSFSNLDTNFEKTTNTFVNDNGNLFTFISGNIYRYPLSGDARVFVDNFNTINGFVFKYNGQNYYSNDEIAISWNY